MFFFSSRRRHTRCALVTGVQTCALPIYHTVFDAASLSKQFTAFAILSLVHEGKLALSDSVRRFVPELGAYADAITIGDLLHHISGIRDFISLNAIEDGAAGKADLTPARVQQLLFRQAGGETPPGTERSEEHTSELQSLMRTSYAVFCLKKKTNRQ